MRLQQRSGRLCLSAQTHAAPPARRLRRGERRRTIVDAATRFFAEEGFQGSTRALAARLGVTQALLYRYFSSKEALVDAVFDELNVSTDPIPLDDLHDTTRPLEDRLGDVLTRYMHALDPTTLRLVFRSGLDGVDGGRRLAAAYRRRIVPPVVAALRDDLGLPDLETRPLMAGEHELAMAPFGSVSYMAARTHILGDAPPVETDHIARMHARAFAEGARNEMRALHRLTQGDPLARPATAPDPW